jgi:predicted metal-dependent hydrolase
VDVIVGMVHMLRRDGQFWRINTWRDGFRFLLGKQGMLRQIWPAYKDYFRVDFHPWQQDTRKLLQQWSSGELKSAA